MLLKYKYINFICNQGKAIVTSLEHLKYFFLYRTNGLDNYNQKVIIITIEEAQITS
jgi:hypothetical protein